MEFKEYLAIIRRRWLLFFPIFLLIVGAHFTWVSYLQKNRFAATTKVVIGNDETSQIAGLSNFPLSPWRGLSRNTKEATLGDYPVLRRAAELARGDRTFDSPQFTESKLAPRIETGIEQVRSLYGDGEEELDRLAQDIRQTLELQALSDGQIVEITCEGADPWSPLMFSWAVSEAASQFHTEKARENVTRFLDALNLQIATAEEEYEDHHIAMATAQQESGIASFDDRQRVILDSIYGLEEQDAKLQANIRKNDRMIQYRLQQQTFGVRVEPSEIQRLERDPEVVRVRTKLIEAKIELDSFRGTLAPRNPRVKQSESVVEGLERLLAETQDRLLSERYQDFTRETNELIKENTLYALEREVMAERIEELNTELLDLESTRRSISPVQVAFEQSQEHLDELREAEKNARWLAAGSLGSVMVHDPALESHPLMTHGSGTGPVVLTLLMAFVFALGVVYVVEYVDTRVKSEHDVRRYLNLPLLGIIPKESGPGRLLTEAPPQSEISEKFNTAATLITSAAKELQMRSLMVCSAIAREGKTTVSVNLAIALARKGAKVVLIDGDLRLSQVHHLLGVSDHVGLSNVLETQVDQQRILEGTMSEEEFAGRGVSALSVAQPTHVPNLDVIASGPPCSDPVQLLESGRLSKAITELKKHYDFVLFDTPPINKVGDALTISSVVDCSVFVVGSGQAEQQDVAWAKHLLSNVQANVLGVFLNKFSKQRGGEYYYYYSDSRRKRARSYS